MKEKNIESAISLLEKGTDKKVSTQLPLVQLLLSEVSLSKSQNPVFLMKIYFPRLRDKFSETYFKVLHNCLFQ